MQAPVREASCHVLAVCHGRVQAQQSRTEKLALVETEFAIEADKLMQTSAKVDDVQLEVTRFSAACLLLLVLPIFTIGLLMADSCNGDVYPSSTPC